MKEINIANVLIMKRKEKGITQDELAAFMGVSKASVSKWETGLSYPDVTFLPVLAAYFNISIDELMDYKPQMSKEDIHRLYRSLSSDFASKPLETVLDDCRQIIKKYYSCFPLLLQMGLLMINHLELVKNPEDIQSLIQEAKELFVRVKEESGDAALTKTALYMEALCNLASGKPEVVLELLDGTVAPALPPESLLASAYHMTGKIEEAKSVLQVGIYQNIVVLFNFFPAYLMLCKDSPEKFEEVLRRALTVSDAFDMKRLHPGVLVGLYITAAQGYMALDNKSKALDMLIRYTETVTGNIYPMKLHGDKFFDSIESWLKKLDLGTDLPRDEITVRQSMANAIINNPLFAELTEDAQYKSIAERLRNNASGTSK